MDELVEERPDIRISYGHNRILKGADLRIPTINLHISLLPWNRGADPNFWSWVEGSPKGVTIHWIDEGIDTGDIIAQREVRFGPDETLATSYAALRSEIEGLFREVWLSIRNGYAPRAKQPPGGSYHRVKDKEPLAHLLTHGWDTPVRYLRRP